MSSPMLEPLGDSSTSRIRRASLSYPVLRIRKPATNMFIKMTSLFFALLEGLTKALRKFKKAHLNW